jgi:hypothetical protein
MCGSCRPLLLYSFSVARLFGEMNVPNLEGDDIPRSRIKFTVRWRACPDCDCEVKTDRHAHILSPRVMNCAPAAFKC